GSHALGVTLDFAPERVEAVMRLCVPEISHLAHADKEQRDERLHDAFMPLLRINHTTAAEVGKRLLTRYSSLLTNVTHPPSRRFLREIDEVRGCIALFVPSELERILSDLHSQEVSTRGRAATALRSIMFEQPEHILDDVCDAIRNESDQHVTNQLLWATYRLIEIAPDKILEALIGSPVLDWSTPSLSAGPVLATLSNLGQLLPTRVVPLLPERLSAYDARRRAWLSEGLAFTWWTSAEYSSEARVQLTRLAVLDIADVPTDYRLFAFRGAIIAQLGLACLDLASTRELQGLQTPYPETEMQFFFVNTTNFVRHHASALLRQSRADQLLDLLLRCLIQESQALVHPLQKTLFRAHNVCTHLCMEMLISLVVAHSDPISLLCRLPRNWRLVYAVHRLLDAGRREASILSFARELCNVPVAGSDVQELGEREQLLAQLVGLSEAPAVALQELQASLPALPFTADDRAEAFTGLAEANLENMLDLLSQSLESEDNLPALYQWGQKARSWQGLLIARVYERIFDARPIHCIEAYERCQQMLTAVHALPRSELQQEYLLVYNTIAQWLKEKLPLKPEFSLSSAKDAMISRSHVFALELLQKNFPQPTDEQELENRLLDMLATGYNRGWWEKTGVALKGDTVSIDTSRDLVYVFPAVRLALIAIEAVANVVPTRDLAAQFLEQRASVRAIIAEHHWQLETNDQETLQTILAAFEQVDYMARRDERVRLNRGYLLIKLDRLTEAEEELDQCLTMPSCIGLTQASTLYDLACIYALTNREELSRTTLLKAIELRPQFREEMIKDPDFVAVREALWFQALHNDGIE
ncbi:MAG: TPR end-of-group domain-containing protein, partial [Ktedonobacteraceae bacterium]